MESTTKKLGGLYLYEEKGGSKVKLTVNPRETDQCIYYWRLPVEKANFIYDAIVSDFCQVKVGDMYDCETNLIFIFIIGVMNGMKWNKMLSA